LWIMSTLWIMWHNNEELSFLIFLLQSPLYLFIYNLNRCYFRGLVQRRRRDIVDYLYIDNVLICLLGT
jgi:hypothetical protein